MKQKRITFRSGLMLVLATILLSAKTHGQTVFTVTNLTDGSAVNQLTGAINAANLVSGVSIIRFNLPGGGPSFTISPTSVLPAITKTVYIDGTTQPGYDFSNPGNPVVIIDGTSVPSGHPGFEFDNVTGAKVTGMYIKSFNSGIILSNSDHCEVTNNVINNMVAASVLLDNSSSFCSIKGNYLNTDQALTIYSTSNNYGVFIRGSNDNIIGGTNCGEGNTIAYSHSNGINSPSVTPGNRNLYSGNLIFGSTGDEIEMFGFGNSGKLPPKTVTTSGCVVSGAADANDVIQIFGSTGGGTTTGKNARVYMGTTTADASGNWSLSLYNIVYPYVIATATDASNNTSEFCMPVAITSDALDLSISRPPSICNGEEVTFYAAYSSCTSGLSFFWDFGDGSASASPSHTFSTAGTYTVTLSVPGADNCSTLTSTATVNVTGCQQFGCTVTCNMTGSTSGPTVSGSDLLFTVTPSGGTAPYTYLWFDESSNLDPITSSTTNTVHTHIPTVGGVSASYTIKVTVTDSNGCTVTKIISHTAS